MLVGFLGLTILSSHGMVMRWKINLDIMVSLLSLSFPFSLSDLLSKQNNRKNMVRVTWMNALSLFVRKNTRNKVRVYKGTRSLNDETLVKV